LFGADIPAPDLNRADDKVPTAKPPPKLADEIWIIQFPHSVDTSRITAFNQSFERRNQKICLAFLLKVYLINGLLFTN
jgi:hypothetical protein